MGLLVAITCPTTVKAVLNRIGSCSRSPLCPWMGKSREYRYLTNQRTYHSSCNGVGEWTNKTPVRYLKRNQQMYVCDVTEEDPLVQLSISDKGFCSSCKKTSSHSDHNRKGKHCGNDRWKKKTK